MDFDPSWPGGIDPKIAMKKRAADAETAIEKRIADAALAVETKKQEKEAAIAAKEKADAAAAAARIKYFDRPHEYKGPAKIKKGVKFLRDKGFFLGAAPGTRTRTDGVNYA